MPLRERTLSLNSLRVCSIGYCTQRRFETKYAGKPKVSFRPTNNKSCKLIGYYWHTSKFYWPEI